MYGLKFFGLFFALVSFLSNRQNNHLDKFTNWLLRKNQQDQLRKEHREIQKYSPIQRTPPCYDPTKSNSADLEVLGRHQKDIDNAGGQSPTSAQYQMSKHNNNQSTISSEQDCTWTDRKDQRNISITQPILENNIGSPSDYKGLIPRVWDAQGSNVNHFCSI